MVIRSARSIVLVTFGHVVHFTQQAQIDALRALLTRLSEILQKKYNFTFTFSQPIFSFQRFMDCPKKN